MSPITGRRCLGYGETTGACDRPAGGERGSLYWCAECEARRLAWLREALARAWPQGREGERR